jgi:dTDP-4-dehydrorhamnose 3,5-epimerase
MRIIETKLSGVKIIEPQVFTDDRGFFYESFQSQRYSETGINLEFVQDNISHSIKGVLRGLHYQLKQPQGKLVTVIKGKVFDVAVDIRRDSPTFGQWIGVILDDENHKQFYLAPGFAHGFYVLSDAATFHYKCTDYYNPEDEYGIIWHDADIAINWPLAGEPIVSDKDKQLPTLSNITSFK